MELNIYGLKCDKCTWRDDTITFDEYPQNIGRGCPECGTNLLTQKEYKACLRMYQFVRIINALKWLSPFYYLRRFVFKRNTRPEHHTFDFPKRKNP